MNLAVEPTTKRPWAAARQAGPLQRPASEQGPGPRTGTAAPLEGLHVYERLATCHAFFTLEQISVIFSEQ